GDVKEVDLALDMPPLQPSVRSTKINELPQVTNLGNDRKGGGIERVIQVGSDYDPRFIESGLNVLDFGSDEVVKLPDELSTNLPFNESNENGDNTESNGGEESIGDVGGDGEEDVGLLSYEIQLDRAREQLLDGGKLSAISPERGLKAVIQAIKRFQELGQAIPVEAKWILGRAYVTQRWGEALVENIPGLADMAISADGQWLWCRCEDNTIWIWDVLRSRKTLGGFKLESGNLGIVKLVFTPDFRFAVGVGVDGLVRVWNMELPESGRSMVVLGGKVSNPVDLQISPDGRWLVVSGVVNDGVVRGGGNNGNNGNNVGANNGGNGGNGGGFVNTAINDFSGSGVVWLWDLDSVKGGEMIAAGEGLEPLVLRGHSKPIRVLKISKDSGWLATGSDDATARIYNLRSAYPGAEQTVLKGHQSGIMSVVFSVEGGWLATGGQDNTIRLWRLSGSTSPPESVELRGHIGWVGSLAVDDSGERLVSGSFDKTVRIWNIPAKNIEQASAQKPTVIQTEQGLVRQLLLTRDGKTLVSLGGDFSLRLWGIGEGGVFELGSTLLIRNRLLPITHIAITPDDRWLIFDYVNQRAPKNSGIRLLHLQLEELLKSAEELKPN
ncbi:MAG: WD40 repeat domain-containing protein, partial [Planctomycetaceae bacterium]|nr:WD40 repeat domain-containing protein [Planctomycetaceae bacterium]